MPDLPAIVFLRAAIVDARVSPDDRGLMPLTEARAHVAALVVFEKGEPTDESTILGSDRAWAALLSLADAEEFLAAALRIRWNFHVRGRDNLAAHERYGDAILPWIAAAVDRAGNLRNVPWCLYPCLLAIDAAEALALAWRIKSVTADLGEPVHVETPPDDETAEADSSSLGVAPQWLAQSLAARLPRVATLAAVDPRARALLARTVAEIGVPSVALLRAHYGDDAAVAAALASLGIDAPTPDPAIEALLADLPRAAVPEGPPWSVTALDGDDSFPYWNVLDGYETPYAVRVSAFAAEAGDVLFVQWIAADQRASESGMRQVAAYGPGAATLDRRRCYASLIAEDDVAGVHLATNDGYIDGISEVARVWGDADAHGVPVVDAYRERYVRNPMPHGGALIALLGTDVTVGPQLPAAWADVALDVAEGDRAEADRLLRSIPPVEGALLEIVQEHRARLFLDEAALRDIASIPASAELLFEVDDPPLPRVFMDAPPSKTAPWPLLCEALRRRVRLDPARVERLDVLRQRLRWTDGRGGAEDVRGPEMPPCATPLPRGDGATPHADALLARGWPHGVRLLHQHPHNDAPAAVFDWVIAQPALPLRSYWAREIAARFARHAGGDAAARDHDGWIYEAESARIVRDVLARPTATLSPLAAEHVTLLLEAFVGAPALLAIVAAALRDVPASERAAARPDGFHAVLAVGWVLRRATSAASLAARDELVALAADFAGEGDLGRALDLALHGVDGARRSARTPAEWLLAGDAAAMAEGVGDGVLPLDVQLVAALGEAAFARWAAQGVPEPQRAWFADELDLLASPRAAALAASLRA